MPDSRRNNESIRKERVPLGLQRSLHQLKAPEGMVWRVFADRGDRLAMALRAGWRFVTNLEVNSQYEDLSKSTTEGLDSRYSRVIGTNLDGSPLRGYLMEIPKELYDEDQQLKEDRIARIEAAMRAGYDQQGGPGEDGRFVPPGNVIKHGSKVGG